MRWILLAAINGARTATDEMRKRKRKKEGKREGEAAGEQIEKDAEDADWREARACKGYEKRILSSLFGMQDEQPGLYAPRVPSSPNKTRKRIRVYPCVWIIRYIENRLSADCTFAFSPITQCQTRNKLADGRLWFESETFKKRLVLLTDLISRK